MSALALIALLLSLHVAVTDLYARRVSNLALAVALVAGTACCLAPGTDRTLPQALVGLGAGLLALLPFRLLRLMGAGDVKYFATLGFLLGWRALLLPWIVASLLAGVHAMAVLGARAWSRHAALPAPLRRVALAAHHSAPWQRMQAARQGRQGIPYAAYLSLGVGCLLVAEVARA